MNNLCYNENCQKELALDSDSYFCDEECKKAYWGENYEHTYKKSTTFDFSKIKKAPTQKVIREKPLSEYSEEELATLFTGQMTH